jgi:recombination protein RecT
MTELMKFDEKMKMLGEYIGGYQKQLTTVLPSHMDSNRLLRICYNTVRRTPKLLDCTFESIVGALLESAYLGLEPSVGGQCWLVPFAKEAVLVAGYRGLVQLALRSDQVQMLYANAVYSKDYFEHKDYPRVLEHSRFKPTEEDSDPGELIGAYSIVSMHAGGEFWIWMDASQIMAIKKRSPGAKKENSPWNSSDIYVRAEMWKKTVLRRHCKVLPMSVEYNRLSDLDDRADRQLPQNLDDNLKVLEIDQNCSENVSKETPIVTELLPEKSGKSENKSE